MNNIIESNDELNNCDIESTPFFSFENHVHLAKIIKCYDGDTIHCIFKIDGEYKKFKIRLYGYDAPEIKPNKNIQEELRDKEKHAAVLAKERLENLILHKNVYLFCKEFDKYGRILAIIKVNIDDPLSVNDIMLKEGHGYTYTGGTKKIYQ